MIDVVKYRKIHEELMKKLDKLENEFLPQVTVDTTEIIYETLRFDESCVKELIVANTGQVPVEFEFIKKLDDSTYCKEWLTITPYTDFIEPGNFFIKRKKMLQRILRMPTDYLIFLLYRSKM